MCFLACPIVVTCDSLIVRYHQINFFSFFANQKGRSRTPRFSSSSNSQQGTVMCLIGTEAEAVFLSQHSFFFSFPFFFFLSHTHTHTHYIVDLLTDRKELLKWPFSTNKALAKSREGTHTHNHRQCPTFEPTSATAATVNNSPAIGIFCDLSFSVALFQLKCAEAEK